MLNILILIIIITWYYILFDVINKKQKSQKIKYIIYTIFGSLVIVFISSIFKILFLWIIWLIIYTILIISIYTDFIIYTQIKEYYLKIKKIKKSDSKSLEENLSEIIKKDIRDIKSSLLNLWWYNKFYIDITIIILWIFTVTTILYFLYI